MKACKHIVSKAQRRDYADITERYHALCKLRCAAEPDADDIANAEQDLSDVQDDYTLEYGGKLYEPTEDDDTEEQRRLDELEDAQVEADNARRKYEAQQRQLEEDKADLERAKLAAADGVAIERAKIKAEREALEAAKKTATEASKPK